MHAGGHPLAAPRSAVPLLGRAAEVGALARALEGGARLVWIVGAAGVGKTRVALEGARAAAAASSARLLCPHLDDCASLDALEDAVAEASRTGTAHRRALKERAAPALAELGPTVLVLDPLDRLEPRELLDAWLDASPELCVVAVARARPAAADGPVFDIGALETAAAIELLVAYGALARPGLALASDDDRAAAERIVTELDALPLAIELAASRLGVMSPQALAHRLKNRWEILRREGPGRHATLEAAIAWSLDLLPGWAKATLAACTVFRGGFSLDAAEAVLPAPEGPDAPPLLDALQLLRTEALLGTEEPSALPGEVRLSMQKSVRLLAQRSLGAADEARLEERHAASFASAAEAWAREVELRGSPEARAHLALERENLVVVVERILGRADVSARAADRALRVLVAVGPVLVRQGASAQLEAHLEAALSVAQGSGADPKLLSRALALRGPLRHARGLRAEGDRDLAEALVLASHAGEQALEGRISLLCAQLAADGGRLDAARLGVERARALARATGDVPLRAHALAAEGAGALREGEHSTARAALEEAAGLARVLGDDALLACAERRIGRLELARGALDAARSSFERARTLSVALGDPRGEALGLGGEGIARGAAGDVDGAVAALEASLAVARRAARPRVLAALRTLAGIAHAAAGARGDARALLGDVADARDLDAELRVAGIVALARLERGGGRAAEADALVDRARDPRPTATSGLGAALDTLLADPFAGTAAPGTDALVAFVRSVPVSGARASARPVVTRTLALEDGARAFTLSSAERVDLSRRRPLRLVLLALAAAHGPTGAPLSWDALLAAGWPGEKMRADAGAHRVRVAISTLRKMGLGPVLETDEAGYRIARDVLLLRT